MTFGQILGLIFIVIGFLEGIVKPKSVWILDPVGWFIAAIAIAICLGIGAVVVPGVQRKTQA